MSTAPAARSLVTEPSAPLKLLPASVASAGPLVAKTVPLPNSTAAATTLVHERKKRRVLVAVAVADALAFICLPLLLSVNRWVPRGQLLHGADELVERRRLPQVRVRASGHGRAAAAFAGAGEDDHPRVRARFLHRRQCVDAAPAA